MVNQNWTIWSFIRHYRNIYCPSACQYWWESRVPKDIAYVRLEFDCIALLPLGDSHWYVVGVVFVLLSASSLGIHIDMWLELSLYCSLLPPWGFTLICSYIHTCILFSDDPKYSIAPFKLGEFLPADRTNFYRYIGSLTTPPCAESVIWTLFHDTIKISNNQVISNYSGNTHFLNTSHSSVICILDSKYFWNTCFTFFFLISKVL